MDNPSERSAVLKFGIVAASALGLAAAFAGLGQVVGDPSDGLVRGLLVVALLVTFVGGAVGGLGVLRYLLAVNSREPMPGDTLGLVLCAASVVIIYVGMQWVGP